MLILKHGGMTGIWGSAASGGATCGSRDDAGHVSSAGGGCLVLECGWLVASLVWGLRLRCGDGRWAEGVAWMRSW